MPILGFLVLNRTFHFHIPLFNIEYKPWRFYLLFCGLPSLFCAIILLFMPESPKFTFSKVRNSMLLRLKLLVSQLFSLFQGNEEETLNILRKIYKINNPKSEVEYNVTKVVEDLEFIDNDSRELNNVSENPFVMLWKQTRLLFSSKNAKKTILVCLMQASAYDTRETVARHSFINTCVIVWTFRLLSWLVHVLSRDCR